MKVLIALLALVLACTPAEAAPPAPAAIDLPVTEFTLKNGMRFIVLPRHDTPTVATYLQFKVGSAMEHPGITGGSHMLEHMMFKGTKTTGTWNYEAEIPLMKEIDRLAGEMVAEQAKFATTYGGGDPARVAAIKAQITKLQAEQKKYMISEELWGIYQRNGGSGLNASTWEDGTNYYVSLPANRLEVWAMLESDRMRDPVFREFYTERDVVNEERRMSVDNDPDGKLFEALQSAVYVSSPYGWPTIGWPGDLNSMRREDMEAYFRRYYAPNNAVAVIVGDVDPAQVQALAEKYFASIPPSNLPTTVATEEMPAGGHRRVEVEHEARPRLYMAWLGPKYGDPDEYVLDVIGEVLSSGRTSRLYTALVEKKRIASSVSAFNYTRRLGNLFLVNATPQGNTSTRALEEAVSEQLDLLKTQPVSQWEVRKVTHGLEADFIRRLQSNTGIANSLGNAEALSGDWRNFDQRRRWYAVTPARIMQVAKKYFTRRNLTVATLVGPAKGVK
ncbi:MAG: insulinase family protein [Armatimonadetes bacterium]|nr:insulinase family protein [Armatimonadota bacterium]